MNPIPHLAVVGAGIAGLSCATTLQQAGLTVTVFEKSRGAGGRMSTRRGDEWQCDHGAQYFTAGQPDFRSEVLRWQQAGVAALWTPRLQVIDGSSALARESTIERFVGLPGMTAPARLLAETLALRSDSTVNQVQRMTDGWHVFTAEHGRLDEHFDAVVLAVPAPQALPLLQEAAPELAALAGSTVMRGAWALMLRFAAPLALPFDAAFVNHGPLRWIARNSSKPGRSGMETWLLHASAEWSEAHLEDDADSVAATLLQAFAELDATVPQARSAHRWRYADSEPALELGFAWDAAKGLGLCGDWLNGGKVEGAWRSGRQLAQAVLPGMLDQRPLPPGLGA